MPAGAAAYADGVASAADSPLWERALQHLINLGDAAFVERMQALAAPVGLTTCEVPHPQRSRPPEPGAMVGQLRDARRSFSPGPQLRRHVDVGDCCSPRAVGRTRESLF